MRRGPWKWSTCGSVDGLRSASAVNATTWELDFDPATISRNHHDGLLGDQLPRVHYLDAAAFEALGNEATWEYLPVWG